MARAQYASLKDLREGLLGVRRDFVARFTGLDETRLEGLEERDEAPTVYETEVLGDLYGLEADLLAELPIRLRPGDSIGTLALQEDFREVSSIAKVKIVGAANAARDLVALRKLAGEPEARQSFIKQVRAFASAQAGQLPFAEGRHYARLVRKRTKAGTQPIPSMRDFVATCFPSISVLYAELGREGVAGVTFADALRGPVIVLNLQAKNTNPCVRRFSLAHELCHLLVDWNRQEPLATLSGFLQDATLEKEQRANAFAARLLCPEPRLKRIAAKAAPLEAAAELVRTFGLHYSAARLYLQNVASVELPASSPPDELLSSSTAEAWAEAERPIGVESFPLAEVPAERRTLVARYAARLYSEGRFGRDRFASLLGVTPNQEVERVLDFFALDPPPDEAVA